MSNFSMLRNQLLKVSELACKKRAVNGSMEPDIDRLVQLLERTWKHAKPMTHEHARILAIMFQKGISSSPNVEPVTLLSELHGNSRQSLRKLPLLCDLIEWGLVSIGDRSLRRRGRTVASGRRIAPSSLLDAEVALSEEVVACLVNGSPTGVSINSRPFRSNADFLNEWFQYLSALYESRGERHRRLNQSEADAETEAARARLGARTEATRRRFPLQILAEKLRLSHDDQIIVMYLLMGSASIESVSEEALLAIVGRTRWDGLLSNSILRPEGTLRKSGLVCDPDTRTIFGFQSREYARAPSAIALLIGKRRASNLALSEALRDQGVLTLIAPKHKLGNLIFPAKTMATLRDALSWVETDGQQQLAEWGFDSSTPDTIKARNCKGGQLRILLHGHPGTGKTALAHAFAHSLRRLILTTDISKILDKWIGESEKKLTEVFDRYNEATKSCPRPPILLLNEADQFLSVRGEVRRSADRMYNQMQNILLERMETFPGILIATTNLVCNIDDAFSRRFDLKIELPRPGVAERSKLWKVLIPHGLPLAGDVSTESLARDFAFTGGQIVLVVRNAAGAAARRTGKDRVVTQADFIRYARLEQSGSFDKADKNPIGFLPPTD